jgi:hypothetical protein
MEKFSSARDLCHRRDIESAASWPQFMARARPGKGRKPPSVKHITRAAAGGGAAAWGRVVACIRDGIFVAMRFGTSRKPDLLITSMVEIRSMFHWRYP